MRLLRIEEITARQLDVGWRVVAMARSSARNRRDAPYPLDKLFVQVQHQSAAAVAPLTDRPRPLTTSSTGQKTFSDPAATSYGSEGRGFEFLRARQRIRRSA
jgi:hypothetical protein